MSQFYLFKILRAHILPLTNCALNKSGKPFAQPEIAIYFLEVAVEILKFQLPWKKMSE